MNVQEYRKQLALVSQEPTLYAGTVRFNVLLGATKPVEEVTQAEIDQACRDANIYDFITSLPQGFDTDVGGKGSQLSGGQKRSSIPLIIYRWTFPDISSHFQNVLPSPEHSSGTPRSSSSTKPLPH